MASIVGSFYLFVFGLDFLETPELHVDFVKLSNPKHKPQYSSYTIRDYCS